MNKQVSDLKMDAIKLVAFLRTERLDGPATTVSALISEIERLERELAGYKRTVDYISGVIDAEGEYVP